MEIDELLLEAMSTQLTPLPQTPYGAPEEVAMELDEPVFKAMPTQLTQLQQKPYGAPEAIAMELDESVLETPAPFSSSPPQTPPPKIPQRPNPDLAHLRTRSGCLVTRWTRAWYHSNLGSDLPLGDVVEGHPDSTRKKKKKIQKGPQSLTTSQLAKNFRKNYSNRPIARPDVERNSFTKSIQASGPEGEVPLGTLARTLPENQGVLGMQTSWGAAAYGAEVETF